MTTPLVSVCIPSYNRPEELRRLLDSIDAREPGDIEIVICEDKSPRRDEIGAQAEAYQVTSRYAMRYLENVENYGYDRNLRELIQQATGEYVVFMGDDDIFLPGGLDALIGFLRRHGDRDLGYVMKTHQEIHPDGQVELFKYFPDDCFFAPSEEAYTTLFRRSVLISGFTIKREYTLPHLTDRFDGTLLFQLYLLAEVTLKHPSAYFAQPIVAQFKGGTPFFGSSAAEKDLYDPGTISIRNSINFMMSYFKITRYIDETHGLNSTRTIREELSKYSYPILSVQRRHGLGHFLLYVRELNKIGINATPHYYLYAGGLVMVGENGCGAIIRGIKRLLGRTPRL